MKRLGTFSTLVVLVLLALALPTAVFADEPAQTIAPGETINQELILYDDTDIEAGATINGDVIVFGGDLNMAGIVNGDVVVFGGDVEISGSISGDLVIFGGDVSISDTGSLGGDCALIGGDFSDRHETTESVACPFSFESPVMAEFIRDLDYPALVSSFSDGEIPLPPELIPYNGIDVPVAPGFDGDQPYGDWEDWEDDHSIGFVGLLFRAIGNGLFMGVVAYLIASTMPDRLAQVRYVLKEHTGASAGVGFLTMIAVPSALVILAILTAVLIFICIGIIGIPIMVVGVLGYIAALFLGLTAVGAWVGDRLADRIVMKSWSSPMRTAFGTAVTVFGLGILAIIPCFPDGLVSFAVLMIGLGGVVLTKFGSQPYPRIVVDEQKVRDAQEYM